MKIKTIVRMLLLAFVAVTLGQMILKESRGRASAQAVASEGASPGRSGAPATVNPDQPASPRWIAYYFHGTRRCNTCRAIEAQAREALETGFPEALLAGLLEWREVNVDDADNAHFVADFGLTGSGLVLVEYREGKQVRFQHLGKVWNLVADRPAFRAYIQEAVRAWLEGA